MYGSVVSVGGVNTTSIHEKGRRGNPVGPKYACSGVLLRGVQASVGDLVELGLRVGRSVQVERSCFKARDVFRLLVFDPSKPSSVHA